MDYQTVLMHIIATQTGGSASVGRIPWNEPNLARRMLEMDPMPIIFPMVNSAQELQEAMDACMYPPTASAFSDQEEPANTAPRI